MLTKLSSLSPRNVLKMVSHDGEVGATVEVFLGASTTFLEWICWNNISQMQRREEAFLNRYI